MRWLKQKDGRSNTAGAYTGTGCIDTLDDTTTKTGYALKKQFTIDNT